ncbi:MULTISPECIES: AAA family ATPase [unclassified Phaeobacter]|uniref:AAA family ATPase n=1 Tax=unclassified Phaeobacter TaxID=2621772 RepID=UPI003A88A8C6
MESILSRAINSSAANDNSSVELFTWATLSPADQPPSGPGQLSSTGEMLSRDLSKISKNPNGKINIVIDRVGYNLGCAEIIANAKSMEDPDEARRYIYLFIERFVNSSAENESQIRAAQSYLTGVKEIISIEDACHLFGANDAKRRAILQKIDQITPTSFEQNLNKIFRVYRDLENRNSVARDREQPEKVEVLPEPAPWDLLNKLFDEGNIPFAVDRPDYLELNSSVLVTLKKKGSNSEINFSDLSSGERIFISFVVGLYNAISLKNTTSFPSLLLLDEIDATLHPSMVKYVLRIIKNTLVSELGIKVIMTTHSPTTVALVEDEEVYEMDNCSGTLKKIGRAKALRILTEALPTLAIDYDARCLVITEDENDATLWSILYRGLKGDISSDSSLNFLGSGVKKEKGGTEGGGCERVKKLVENMVESKIKRLVGMIDWDLMNSSSDSQNVHVLCEGQRYAIENLLLDPVLCIRLMCKRQPEAATRAGYLSETEGDRSLDTWCDQKWQVMVDKFCAEVLPDDDRSKTDAIEYMNGRQLDIPISFLQMNGHDLQKKIVEKYGCLLAYEGQGKLLTIIAQHISVGDYEGWYPKSIVTTMNTLINLATDH